MRTAWIAVLGTVTAVSACGPSVDFVRAPRADWPFFLILEAEGVDPEVSGPHRWTDQDPAFRFGVRGAERIELLAVDLEGLLRGLPAAAADAVERVRVKPRAESCADGRVSDGGLRVPLSAPHAELFRLLEVEFEPEPLTDRPMTLWVPTDHDHASTRRRRCSSPMEIAASFCPRASSPSRWTEARVVVISTSLGL